MMKPVSPKTLLSLSSTASSPSSPLYSIFVSRFTTHALTHQSRRHEEESRNVRVSVWWDFENCNVPAGVNVFKVAHTITAAVRASGIKGPITITAFGDMLQLSRFSQEALSSTGINMAHVPRGGKNSADRSLLVDLMYWVSQNPPPAHLFLISGDRDFATILHRLRMNNYNILLASPESAPNVLCSAASIMWHWNSLARGENLTGKHFNQPPDGPYGSWYGHYKVPLEDPFLVAERSERSAYSRTDDFSETSSESKVRPVPKIVLRQIRQVLNSHPKGISITEFREELKNSSVSLDKDLYGHGKFSRFLLSMPHILKLQSMGDGVFTVHGVTPKAPEPFESTPGTSNGHTCRNGEQDLSKSLKLNGEDRCKEGAVDSKSTSSLSPKENAEEPSIKVQQAPTLSDKEPSRKVQPTPAFSDKVPPRKVQLAPTSSDKMPPRKVQPDHASSDKVVHMDLQKPLEGAQKPPPTDKNFVETVVSAREVEGQPLSVVEQDSAPQVGFFKQVWRRWFGGKDSHIKSQDIPQKSSDSGDISEKISHTIPEKSSTSGDNLEKKNVEGMSPPSQHADLVQLPLSSASNTSGEDRKIATSSLPCSAKDTSPGFLQRILNRCKFWSSSSDSVTLDDQTSEKLDQVDNNSQKHQVFSEDSFWCDMKSFIDSARGLAIVSESRTREQMAQSLQKEGPLALRDLSEGDLLKLVNLLISEKKWLEECPSLMPPFKLTQPPVEKKSSLRHSGAANGLTSIFMANSSKSNLKKIPEHDEERKVQNISHGGVSSPVKDTKPSIRSRNDVLADCQKLVNELLEKHQGGHNLGTFRKMFVERFGYHLDIQKLGHKKLASLLQTMPGVKIESTYIFPSSNIPGGSDGEMFSADSQDDNAHSLSNSDSESSEISKKSDDSDSAWEELGPVSDATSHTKEVPSLLKAVKETKTQKYPDYEPSVSDDELSDSGEETSAVRQPERQGKLKINEENSSLLQILDSWYSSKDKKDQPGNVDGMVDCSINVTEPSASPELAFKREIQVMALKRKSRPQKNFNFVSDSGDENNKDKLIDGILGSLKKTGESRGMQN